MKKIISFLTLATVVFSLMLNMAVSAAETTYEGILNKRLISGIAYSEAGDVNIDGITDIRDLVRLKKVSAQQAQGDADLNGDSAVDATDLSFLSKFILNYDENAVIPSFDNEVADNWDF